MVSNRSRPLASRRNGYLEEAALHNNKFPIDRAP